MFKKPFKVKSNTGIRGSERRKLKENVSKIFPNLSTEELLKIIPNKEELSVMKLLTHNGITVSCYCLKKNPILFETNGILLPTVYLLWNHSYNMLSFQTHPNVLNFLAGGADLMFPGVYPPIDADYPDFSPNTSCYVNLLGNSAAIAVGVTQCSKQEVLTDGPQGKRVTIYHCYKDCLWNAGDKTELPLINDALLNYDSEFSLNGCDVNATLEESSQLHCDEIASSSASIVCEENNCDKKKDVEKSKTAEETAQTPQEEMDILLINCFCQALLDAKKVELPILVSKFSSMYLHPSCPDGKRIDVKKSSYKKMSKFLAEMQYRGMVEVKELSKGVESIVKVNFENDTVRTYRHSEFAQLKKELKEMKLNEEKEEQQKNNQVVEVRDLYSVSAKTSPFFKQYNIGKGVPLSSSDVRKYITQYVKEHALVDPKKKQFVMLDAFLTDTLYGKGRHEEQLTWDALVNCFLTNMNSCHEITLPGQQSITKKGKLELIEVCIEQRMGNKKVTIIKNLEMFGIDPKTFAQELQQYAASSTTVNPAPGKNSINEFVMVQGMQIKHVQRLLEHHKVPKKFVKGLENKDTKQKR